MDSTPTLPLPARMTMRRIACAAGLLALSACSAHQSNVAPEVQAAFTRETDAELPHANLLSSDGLVRAEVEAAAPPYVARDEAEADDPTAYRMEIPIGDDE